MWKKNEQLLVTSNSRIEFCVTGAQGGGNGFNKGGKGGGMAPMGPNGMPYMPYGGPQYPFVQQVLPS